MKTYDHIFNLGVSLNRVVADSMRRAQEADERRTTAICLAREYITAKRQPGETWSECARRIATDKDAPAYYRKAMREADHD